MVLCKLLIECDSGTFYNVNLKFRVVTLNVYCVLRELKVIITIINSKTLCCGEQKKTKNIINIRKSMQRVQYYDGIYCHQISLYLLYTL